MPSISALKSLVIKAQGGDMAAAHRLCLKRKPKSLNELLFVVYPVGEMTAEQFDCCADAFAMWEDENASHL